MAILSIPARLPFADTLAAGLLAETGADPLALARMTILLPTRRAGRTLREAFLRRSDGRPLLLPRLLAVGALGEDEALFAGFQGDALPAATDLPPEIPPLRRRLLLATLVEAWSRTQGQPLPPDQATALAAELARLIDQVQTEGLDFSRLPELVGADYAAHWQVTLDFLSIVTQAWPALLAEEGCIDPADRRGRLLTAQAAAWKARPPAGPVVAAGLTGSIPAVAALLETVAGLPQGRVVLPGLDRALEPEAWAAVDETHPQHGLKTLLDRLNVAREAVGDWPGGEQAFDRQALAPPDRERLAAEALRPAAATHRWRDLTAFDDAALRDLDRLDCPTPREEALAIALLLRDALETPGRTAALVTADRDLARRVAAEMTRWGVTVDDSAGRPLAVTPPGAFLRLTAAAVAEGFAPVPLLAALKHPLAAAGQPAGKFRAAVRRLERVILRGVRPGPGFAGLRDALTAAETRRGAPLPALWELIAQLEAVLAPFVLALESGEPRPLAELLELHLRAAEALAATDDTAGPLRLWAEAAGEAAATFASDLAEAARGLPPLAPAHYPGLLDALMVGASVRPEHGAHPRVTVLGPLEARLQHADLMILGGLNEGTWPPRAPMDPWMSRPMRADFGLPQPEARIGQAAHDFASLLCARHVVLTRAEKVEGTPTVPSRWLLRLDAVLRGVGQAINRPPQWLTWAEGLDRPTAAETAAAQALAVPPAPCPPLDARPRALSATRVEMWMRDPYAIHARYILGLEALEPLDAEPGPADYGTLVHAALQRFQETTRDGLPPDVEGALLACGREAFAAEIARPAVWAFWWPRYAQAAAWLAGMERARRPRVRETFVEIKGSLSVDGFTLTATADRLDLLHDGTLAIMDYKTGSPPSALEVTAGFAPQLPLEAVIARAGGFPGVPAREVSELLYWRLKGGRDGGEEKHAGKSRDLPGDPRTLADEALNGLRGLIQAYGRPETPYAARPNPHMAPRYSDYAHLARVKEWAAADDAGDGGEA